MNRRDLFKGIAGGTAAVALSGKIKPEPLETWIAVDTPRYWSGGGMYAATCTPAFDTRAELDAYLNGNRSKS